MAGARGAAVLATTKGWRDQCSYIDAAHRVHARVEDIRTGKDTGLGHFPSHDYGLNKAWLDASMIACILLSCLKLLALDGDLAKAEPKTPRYRVLDAAARLVRGGPQNPEDRRHLALGSGDHHCLAARPGHPAPNLTSTNPSRRARKETQGPVEPPATRARQPGHRHTPGLKSRSRIRPARTSAASAD